MRLRADLSRAKERESRSFLYSMRDLLAGIEEETWWTHLDSNQGPLACEASALTGLSYASTASLELSRRGHGVASPTSLLRSLRISRDAPAGPASSVPSASSPEITKVGDVRFRVV